MTRMNWVVLGTILGTSLGLFGLIFMLCRLECGAGPLSVALSYGQWAVIIALPICWKLSRSGWSESRPWWAVILGMVGGIMASFLAFFLLALSNI